MTYPEDFNYKSSRFYHFLINIALTSMYWINKYVKGVVIEKPLKSPL